MKILIVQDRLRSGGTERQSILLANAFSKNGHAVMLLTFRPGGALQQTVSTSVQRMTLQPFDLGLDFFAPGLSSAAKKYSPDIVLCMGRMANCYAGLLQKQMPQSTVMATIRTGKSLPYLFRRSLQSVQHVVANSHEAKANLVKLHSLTPERISVIHNSLVFSALPPAATRTEQRMKMAVPPATAVLLSVAMFRPEKGQRELIEIVSGLPESQSWRLWLAGDGEERGACENLVREKGLTQSVKFLGWQKDPAPLYAAADIAIHASTSEALSNFLIEAQAQGLPAVAYDTQGISECFVPNKTGFAIVPGDREGFQKQLGELMSLDEARRRALAEQARAFATDAFDHDRQVARYLNLFEELRRARTQVRA
jgi:glycosyltransferase involved in cell wall biosynthesis